MPENIKLWGQLTPALERLGCRISINDGYRINLPNGTTIILENVMSVEWYSEAKQRIYDLITRSLGPF